MINFIRILLILFILNSHLYSDEADILFGKAWTLIQNNKYQDAYKVFIEIIKKNNDYGPAYRDAGWLLYDKLNKPKDSIQYLNKAEKLLPEDPLVYLYSGLAYSKLENYSETIKYYQNAIFYYNKLQQPVPTGIYIGIGELYMYKTNPHLHQKAIEMFLIGLKDDLDNTTKKML